jgi:hypothetical protein
MLRSGIELLLALCSIGAAGVIVIRLIDNQREAGRKDK